MAQTSLNKSFYTGGNYQEVACINQPERLRYTSCAYVWVRTGRWDLLRMVEFLLDHIKSSLFVL